MPTDFPKSSKARQPKGTRSSDRESAQELADLRRGALRLARLKECFLGFGADPLENINRLTATAGDLLGAACALYNRLDRGMLCSWGQWKAPQGYKSIDPPDGHICYDVIRRTSDAVLVVRNLPDTAYALSDPNVRAYGLQTYIGQAVKFGGKCLGSLCVVYQSDFVPSDDDKRILGAIARAIGVEEERALTNEALRSSRETLLALINSSPLAIVTFDPEGNIRMWNLAAERMFGWSAKEVMGRPHPIVPADKQEEFRAFREFAMGGGTFTGRELRRLRKDGTNIDISVSTAPLRDASGAITSVMSIITDISERKRAEEALRHSEEQLRQAQKMEAVGRLAGGIAHDFNNLLMAITGYSELLLDRVGDNEPMWREIEEIRKAGARAASLTRQLLAFSRRQVLQPKLLDVNGVVLNVERMLRRLIGEDVELVTSLDDGLGKVRADPGQIEQVIMNLVVNSRDAMPSGGKLVLRTANVDVGKGDAPRHPDVPEGDWVLLSVSDMGTGMSDEVKAHLFEPFFTTKEKGTGLGLATVYGIVRQSGGHVRADSEPGRGTTMEIYLPRLAGAADLHEETPTASISTGGKETILVAEDEDMVRELVCEILQRSGYAVLEACNGEEALEAALQHGKPIHLLVTDVVMPRMSGHDLAERLVPLRPEMKVLFMSGYTDKVSLHHRVLNREAAFLQKPFGPGTLTAKVREVLDAGPLGTSG
ncbi:MAG: PAS domain S-box protein [Deltaproteobacteria bacterium]|nr:PAS domain S-box protein [Deltaproteobacteria bacterium]